LRVAEQAMEEMRRLMAEFEKRPRMTVAEALRRGVAAGGDFLQFEGATYTFADVDRLSTAFAHELRKLGIARGHTVAALLNNSIDQIVTWFAVNKLGGVWVPLNIAYRGEFLRHQLTDSSTRVLVCEAAYLDRALEVEHALVDLKMILCRGAVPAAATESRVPVAALDDYRGEDETPLGVDDPAPGDLSMLIYTSGTTGPSKGCMISHNFICHQAIQSNLAIPPMAGDVLYTCLPLFHVSAVDTVLSGLLTGTKVYVAEKFSASRFWHEVRESGATNARLMSSIFPIVADGPETPEMRACYGQLRAVSGSPIPPEVRRKWHERFGVKFLNSFAYGLSEGVRLSMSRIGEDIPEDSVGRIDDTAFEVAILDDEDRQLPEGQIGEIAFRPKLPNVMFEGYWRRPEETVKVWRNLWMHTGDMGRITDGFLFFTDRKKDYVRSRGENISSFEVESAVISHPEVLEVAAHAADAGRGEDCLKLTVVLAPGSTLTEEELCRWCVDNLPCFAVPRYIEFRQELPKTPTSKVQKNVLREEGVTSRTWERDPSESRRR
jgi:crotonobetaine/carnitine-CoA ligase